MKNRFKEQLSTPEGRRQMLLWHGFDLKHLQEHHPKVFHACERYIYDIGWMELVTERLLKRIRVKYKREKLFIFSDGTRIRADFYLPEYQLVIECDEKSHNHPVQKRKDHIKNQLYHRLGLGIVRVKEKAYKINPLQALLSAISKVA